MKIVDISKWDQNIDFIKLKNEVELVIARVSAGTNLDSKFNEYAQQMINNQIPFGVYCYSYAKTVEQAQVEAEKMVDYANPFNPLFYVIDAEEKYLTAAIITAFRNKLVSLNCAKIGCYVAHHLYQQYNFESIASLFDFIWIPRYSESQPKFYCDLWQYTEQGTIAGIKGKVDLNKIISNRYDLNWFLDKESDISAGVKEMRTLKKGSKGNDVKALQYFLDLTPDGIFGNATKQAVIQFQTHANLTADGIVGTKTFEAISQRCNTVKIGDSNKYVAIMECIINGMVLDKVYKTEQTQYVKTFQAAAGLTADGIVGQKTWAQLWGVSSTPTVDAKQPVNYKQYDSRWGSIVYTQNNTYNKKQTIKNSGCGTTSAAMIIATWWDKNITPKETSAEAVEKGYRTKNSGTDWGFFKYTAQKYGASKFVQTKSFATMQECLKNGGYVVASMGPGKFTSGGHYIVLWKDTGSKIMVNDPASAAASRTYGTYNEIKNQSKQFFCFYK